MLKAKGGTRQKLKCWKLSVKAASLAAAESFAGYEQGSNPTRVRIIRDCSRIPNVADYVLV